MKRVVLDTNIIVSSAPPSALELILLVFGAGVVILSPVGASMY